MHARICVCVCLSVCHVHLYVHIRIRFAYIHIAVHVSLRVCVWARACASAYAFLTPSTRREVSSTGPPAPALGVRTSLLGYLGFAEVTGRSTYFGNNHLTADIVKQRLFHGEIWSRAWTSSEIGPHPQGEVRDAPSLERPPLAGSSRV